MFQIGICDDEKQECQKVYELCEEYFRQHMIEHKYTFFSSGEEVLQYCSNTDNERIDLLFLDVEMSGISGIELKDIIIKQRKIWRISFVTNHLESIYGAFSKKTIGFIPKPPVGEKVKKAIQIVLEELEEECIVTFKGYSGEDVNIKLEDIAYFKAHESYTEIITYASVNGDSNSGIVSKKLGDIEKELREYAVVRVHKSYLVNLANVNEIGKNVIIKDLQEEIPVGRVYKENAKKIYFEYRKDKIKKRL